MENAAAFHQLLSNSATALSSLEPNNPQHSIDAVYHQTVSVQHIYLKLDNVNHANYTGTLCAVLTLASHANLSGHTTSFNLHMHAVQKIMKLVGDPLAIHIPRSLRLLLLWVDVTGSAKQDVKPHFPLPEHYLRGAASSDIETESFDRSTDFNKSIPPSGGHDLLPIMVRLRGLSRMMEHNHDSQSLTAQQGVVIAGFTVIPLLHRLLMLRHGNVEPIYEQDMKLQLVRLAAILFLAQLRRHLAGQDLAQGWQSHITRIRLLITSIQDLEREKGRERRLSAHMRLWVLVLAYMEIRNSPEKEWLLGQIEFLIHEMRLHNQQDMENALRDVLWITELYSARLHTLYMDLERRRLSCEAVEP